MSDRPMYIHSRATRMWKVIRVHSVENPTPIEEGKFLVLKDFWIPHDIPTEVENQQRLFEAVDAFIADPHWKADPRLKEFDKKTTDRLEELFTDKKYQSLFLTNLHAWRGRTSKPVAKGAWISPDPSQYRLWEPWLTSSRAGHIKFSHIHHSYRSVIKRCTSFGGKGSSIYLQTASTIYLRGSLHSASFTFHSWCCYGCSC